uniref:Uncharacterized protein n=1 Tax=Anguilla anguilla TaxID=7936 RepID=A0A0E9UQW5_ANGAN
MDNNRTSLFSVLFIFNEITRLKFFFFYYVSKK